MNAAHAVDAAAAVVALAATTFLILMLLSALLFTADPVVLLSLQAVIHHLQGLTGNSVTAFCNNQSFVTCAALS